MTIEFIDDQTVGLWPTNLFQRYYLEEYLK
jgi:hypothetical protein